jgi:site-specific recombinase XerD
VSAQPRRIGPQAIELAEMVPSWVRSLEAENKSARTITSYTHSVRRLAEFAGIAATTDITTDDLRRYFAAEQGKMAPASVAVHYRNLRVFLGWLSREEPSLMPASPMAGIKAPTVPKKRKPPMDDDQVRALLAECSKDTFEDRRDTALIRVLIDTGMRISGLAGIRYPDHVKLSQRILIITLKGGDEIAVPIGKKSIAALDRYLRARTRHAHADLPWLWLGPRGQFTHWGIRQMLERRAQDAEIEGVHPHRFRRSFAQNWLKNGGTEYDLMKITGWKTRDMIAVYTEELGEERARTAHARLTPGDRI